MRRLVSLLVIALMGLTSIVAAAPVSAQPTITDPAYTEATRWYVGTDASVDPGGASYWAATMSTGVGTTCASQSARYRTVVNAFLNARNIGPQSTLTKVRWAYRSILNRYPDPGGNAYWMGQLAAGVPWTTMTGAMVNTAEWRARDIGQVNPNC